MTDLKNTVAIDANRNRNRAARLYVCHDGESTQVYEGLSNAMIDALNSWIDHGFRVVHADVLKINTTLYR